MDYTVTAAQLPAVLARLTVRETAERCAQHEITVLRLLPRCLWAAPPCLPWRWPDA
jgi:hypothetical protein